MEGSMAPETTAGLLTLEAELSDCRRVLLQGSNTHSCNDQVFGLAADVECQLGGSLDEASIGDFLDVCALLCLAQDSFVDGKTHVDKSRLAFNIKSTNVEVDIVSAMSHPAPLTLFGEGEGKSALVAPKEGFGFCLKDFGKHRGRHVNSFRQDIQKKNHIIALVRGLVKGTGAAAQLSKHLSVESRNHLSELLGHWLDWHEEMAEQCGCASIDAWCFIVTSVNV